MGKQQSKQEEININQNAAGGNNQANGTIEDIKLQLSLINVVMLILVLLCCCGCCAGLCKLLQKFQLHWMRREINQGAMRYSFLRRQRTIPKIDEEI